MSYIGRGLEQVDNISKLDNITFNGGTTYALTKDSSAFTPISSNSLLISVSGVIQQGNFSVDGTNIVFNTAVASSESCDFIMHYGTGVAFTPADSSVTKDKANFISTSSSAGLQIKGDGTTDGTLQLNCSQNTHGVKIKSPAHSASQSYTLTLPTTSPASNKMLQTDGSGNLSFVDAPSGGLVYLGGSESSSSASAVTFDNVFSSTYRAYKVIGMFAPSQDTWFKWRYRSGGSDVNANTYTNVARTTYNDNTDSFAQYNWGANQRTYGQFATADVDSDANSSYVVIDWTFYDPNTDVFSRSQMTGLQTFRNGGNGKLYVGYMGQGQHSNTNNDGVKFETNAGTISYHSVRIYGVVNS